MIPSRDDLRPGSEGGVSLWYIATRAGISGRSDNWILNYVRMLHANEGFPDPLPNFTLGGKKRTGILFSSRWLRAAVDAWFAQYLPAELVAVLDEQQLREDAEKLDQRAELIGAGAAPEAAPAFAGGQQ